MQVAEKGHEPTLSLGEERNMVTKLVSINLTVFVLLFFIKVIFMLGSYHETSFEEVADWLTLPASPARLLVKPWSLLTFMFSHGPLGNAWFDVSIVYDMVWLYFFGTILQRTAGYQRIVPLYVFGGLAGAVFYIAGMNLIPGFRLLASSSFFMGAGPSVMAIAVAATVYAPGYRLLTGPGHKGGIPLWIISALYFVLLIGANVMDHNFGGIYLLLAGGALTGFVLIHQYQQGRDWGARLNRLLYRASHMFHPDEDNTREQLLSHGMPFRRTAPRSASVTEAELNEVLDKINMQGIDALSVEEKDTLLRASKRD
ncbi:rhomboid family intramembrane serine protease [Chitinophaga parva]|nr:rhomboid family intramembrane serine protease [Chitinophaga parva]